MPNPMQQMLAQAQRMQRELKKAHDELEQKEFKVSKSVYSKICLQIKKNSSILRDKST